MSFSIVLVLRDGAKLGSRPSLMTIGCTAATGVGSPAAVVALSVAEEAVVTVADVVDVAVLDDAFVVGTMFSRDGALFGCFGCDSLSRKRTNACAMPSLL